MGGDWDGDVREVRKQPFESLRGSLQVEDSKCKGPEAGACLVHSRSIMGASMMGPEQVRQRREGDEARG